MRFIRLYGEMGNRRHIKVVSLSYEVSLVTEYGYKGDVWNGRQTVYWHGAVK